MKRLALLFLLFASSASAQEIYVAPNHGQQSFGWSFQNEGGWESGEYYRVTVEVFDSTGWQCNGLPTNYSQDHAQLWSPVHADSTGPWHIVAWVEEPVYVHGQLDSFATVDMVYADLFVDPPEDPPEGEMECSDPGC